MLNRSNYLRTTEILRHPFYRNFVKEIYNADGKEELVEALDTYIDSIKTLPRDWNPKAYIEPPGGESEHEKGLQIPEEEVPESLNPSLLLSFVTIDYFQGA